MSFLKEEFGGGMTFLRTAISVFEQFLLVLTKILFWEED